MTNNITINQAGEFLESLTGVKYNSTDKRYAGVPWSGGVFGQKRNPRQLGITKFEPFFDLKIEGHKKGHKFIKNHTREFLSPENRRKRIENLPTDANEFLNKMNTKFSGVSNSKNLNKINEYTETDFKTQLLDYNIDENRVKFIFENFLKFPEINHINLRFLAASFAWLNENKITFKNFRLEKNYKKISCKSVEKFASKVTNVKGSNNSKTLTIIAYLFWIINKTMEIDLSKEGYYEDVSEEEASEEEASEEEASEEEASEEEASEEEASEEEASEEEASEEEAKIGFTVIGGR